MRKFIILIWCISISFSLNAQNLIEQTRIQYKDFVHDKTLCAKSLELLEQYQDLSPLHRGYLGALQTIWAQHVFNPVNKLKTFNAGKKNIELAIKSAPHEVELRFIRLSVQKNAPAFLGYNHHIKEDEKFLLKNRTLIQSAVLRENIQFLLK